MHPKAAQGGLNGLLHRPGEVAKMPRRGHGPTDQRFFLS
jgi:hypothetical protein